MGEKRTSQAIPDDVWNKVIEGAKEENEIHWKGKKIDQGKSCSRPVFSSKI